MKKYLFHKIIFEQNRSHSYAKFSYYRKPTIAEMFLADMLTDEEYTIFTASSFRRFLTLLSKTKLNEDGQYDIYRPYNDKYNEKLDWSFDDMLKHFVSIVYADEFPDKKAILKFYDEAYKIKQEAENRNKVLDIEPSELGKQ